MGHCLSAVFSIENSGHLPDLELGSSSLELLCELVVNTLLDVNPGTSTTSLTVVEAVISGEHKIHQMNLQDTLTGVCDGVVNIGIIEDDVGTLSTELERDLLQVTVCGLFKNLLSDSGRTSEGDLVDSGGGGKGLSDGRTVTDNDVDDTSGDTSLLDELGHVHGSEGSQLGGLHDDGTSGCECWSDLPGEHVEGLRVSAVSSYVLVKTYEVPGDDLTTDTDGFVSGEGELVLAGLNGLTMDLVCPSTVVSEDSSGFSDVETLGNSKGLSVVEGFKGSKDIDISLHQGSNLHEQLASLETWNVESPGGVEGIVGSIKSDLNVGSETLGDLDEDLTSGRVVDAEHQNTMTM